MNDSAPAQATMASVLAGHARTQADAILLIAPETGATLTYAGLHRLAGQLDRWFHDRGIDPGEHVAMYLPNGLVASALFLATMATGRVIAPLSLVAQPSQLRYVLGHCEAKCVFAGPEQARNLHDALAEPDQRVVLVDPDDLQTGPWSQAGHGEPAGAVHEPHGWRALSADAGALLMYTSGTTGVPKGVPLSHRNLLHAAFAAARWHGLGPADRVLSALPLYHINGQVIATLTPFVSGGSIVAPVRFSVSTWWQAALDNHCTWLNMVPTIIAYLLNAKAQAPYSLPAIRFGRSASAPLPPEHHQAFEARFGFPVIEAMGMTETASVVFCNPMPPAARRSGTPGLPLGVQVRIIGDDGSPVADGDSGEICLRGPSVMQGYFKSAEQTAKAFTADGWLRSGDLGRRDSDGYHYITGRLKELIIKGGENIAPREIDEALLQHPAVLEAAAVGIPDEAYGQDILAAIVLKPGQSVDEPTLRAFCERELGRYKTPRHFRFVNALPKGASGKVQRLKLLEDE